MLRVAFLILLTTLIAGKAGAQLSFLDPTFGNNGVAIKSIKDHTLPRKMIRQADGKLIVVGVLFLIHPMAKAFLYPRFFITNADKNK